MNDQQYFVYDPEGHGMEFFGNSEEAEKTFRDAIKSYEEDSKENGEYCEEGINELRMGKVLRQCVIAPHSVDGDGKELVQIVTVNYGHEDE